MLGRQRAKPSKIKARYSQPTCKNCSSKLPINHFTLTQSKQFTGFNYWPIFYSLLLPWTARPCYCSPNADDTLLSLFPTSLFSLSSETHVNSCKNQSCQATNFFNRVNCGINFFNCGFNAHVVCYIFQFVCVPFSCRNRRPIAVER